MSNNRTTSLLVLGRLLLLLRQTRLASGPRGGERSDVGCTGGGRHHLGPHVGAGPEPGGGGSGGPRGGRGPQEGLSLKAEVAGAVPPALRLFGAALPRAEPPPLLPVELLADAIGRGDDVALLVLVRSARRQRPRRGRRRSVGMFIMG